MSVSANPAIAPTAGWKEVQPCGHFVQFYRDEAFLLDSVNGFVGSGLSTGAGAVVIATRVHLAVLERQWTAQGIDLRGSGASGRYVARDAVETLDQLLLDGRPDAELFASLVEPIVAEVAARSNSVVVFGEMVALLWRQGKHGSAIQLEDLWNELGKRHAFTLFCAYPIVDMAGGSLAAMHAVCGKHTLALPSEDYAALKSPADRLVEICELQHSAGVLEQELVNRKAAERMLASREQDLIDVLENAAQAIHSVGSDGRIQWANQYELDLLGYAPDEYIGHDIAEFHADKGALESILQRLHAGETLSEHPARVIRRDGSIRDVLITSNVRRNNGTFVHSRCFTRDVTEQVRAERALREIEERTERTQALLAAIVASSDDAIVSKSLDGCIRTWNEGATRLFGYAPEEAVGKPITMLIPPELQEEEREIIRKLSRGERVDHFESVRIAKNGRRIDVSLTISPVRDPRGNVIGASKVARDITERKRLQARLREAERHKDDFIAMLGHELRNPLAPIRNIAELLRRTIVGNPAHDELCRTLERQVQQMTRLLDDLLDVSRITQGKINFRDETVDLMTVVSRAVESVRPLIDARCHRLKITAPKQAVHVRGDMARLVQMTTNLLHNAAKYTPDGGLLGLCVEAGAQTVDLRVKDDGVGIEPDLLPRIFDLYVQADPAPYTSKEGLGVGLTLVRSIAEHHGGTVHALSRGPGCGSEFIVSLPTIAVIGATAMSAPATHSPLPPSNTSRRILLVDDNRDASESLAILLRLNGHDVTVAADAASALDIVQAMQPDLALLDIGLPGMDGYELARRIRQSGCAAILAAVTGFGTPQDHARSLEAGFDHHFVKPLDPHALEQLIARVPPAATIRAAA